MKAKQLCETASNALTYVKRNASKGAVYGLVLGSSACGVAAMAEEATGWPTADSVLSNLQSSLGPWVTMALTVAVSVFVLKLGYGYAKQFLNRS
ncbi:MAG: hypothetical protein IIW01_02935 [Thermoguttaceae bacterium]|nr:hypothetical protein [Thermoguttaceae bacterium]